MKEKYIETLLAQIREKRARASVRQEVEGHILDQESHYIEQGMPKEQAEERAIRDMGDPVETGVALDQLHRPKPAWGMLALTAVLCAAGLLLLYIAQTYSQPGRAGAVYFQNQCKYVVLGFFVLCVVYLTDYTRIAVYSRAACTIILLALSAVAGGLLPTYGPDRFYLLGNFSIGNHLLSIDLLLYLYLPLYGALLYAFRGCKARQLLQIVLYTILPIILARQTVSLSVTINISAILFLMLGTAVGKGWFLPPLAKRSGKNIFSQGRKYTKSIYVICMGAAAFFAWFLFLVTRASYQKLRIQAWLHPENFAGESGYISSTIRNIVGTSRLIGRNTGQAADVYLPEYITDYILTYTLGTFGILAAAALVILVVVFGVRLLHISIHQKNQLGMMMGLACSLSFVIQSAEYIFVNLSLLPPAGIYFPLISFGGNGMIQTCILLGILLSIYRYEDVVPNTESCANHVLQ